MTCPIWCCDARSVVAQAFYDTLVCSTLEEMCHEYVYSMKKAMIDYVITSSVERARLNLGPLEQLLVLPTPTQVWQCLRLEI